jgi:hypothetical protein
MKRLAVLALVGCSSPAKPAVVVAPLPAASTTCYAGITLGMGQRARTIARRVVDPAAGQIIEDVSHHEAGAHGARSFHVVMKVENDQFTMTESGGAFTGTGSLAGEPWRWTSWSSTSRMAGGIEVASDDELTPRGMKATKEIRKGGKVVATTVEELATFDCAEWDKAKAELDLPTVDTVACENACRNYATLKYWAAADPAIAQLPAAERDAARQQKLAELVTRLEAGLPACTEECVAAGNDEVTACMTAAKTADAATACTKE